MSHVATLTIDHTKVAGDLTDYVVYVDLSHMPASFWDTVANGGGDIRIFKSDGTTELAREVVSCVISTDTGELHLKFSGTLSSTVDTDIEIHADGTSSEPAFTATYGRNAVWSAYRAVFHLNDLIDSTGNGYTLTNTNSVTMNAAGKLGGAADFTSGNTNKTLSVASDLGISSTAYTIDMWISKYNVTAYGQGHWIINANTNRRYYGYYENSGGASFRFAHEGNSGTVQFNVSASWSNNQWLKNTQTWDNSVYRGYTNGSFRDSRSTSGNVSAVTNTFRLGAHQGGTAVASLFWQGLIDEVRVRNATNSANQITTEYNNENSASTFYSVAAVDMAIPISVIATGVASADITTNTIIALTLASIAAGVTNTNLTKSFLRTLESTAVAVTSIAPGSVFQAILNVTASASTFVALQTAQGLRLTATAIAEATSNIQSTFSRTLGVVAEASTTIARQGTYLRNLVVTAIVTPELAAAKTFFVTLLTTAVATATNQATIAKVLQAVAGAVTKLGDYFYKRKYPGDDEDNDYKRRY